MALVENTLFGIKDKVAIAIERIKTHEQLTREFRKGLPVHVAFSGGKDSMVIAELCKMAGIDYQLHYAVTQIDPPELMRFIKQNYPECIWQYPKLSMPKLILKYNMLPTRIVRYCCKDLKETYGKGMIMMGIRWAESVKRSKRVMFEYCAKRKVYLFAPIIDWSEQDVWDFIHNRKLPYCSLYDEGFTRIGCILCPMAHKAQRIMAIKRFPRIANNWYRWMIPLFEQYQKTGFADKFKYCHPSQIFEWWVFGKDKQEEDYNECLIFDD